MRVKTIKKAECWRIDAFKLWCWRRLLRVHWTARRSNQSILKEISPEHSLEGLMLKLKLQYFGLFAKSSLFGKGPDARKDWRQEKWMTDGWMASPSQWTWVWASSQSWWWTGSLACCSPWGHKESDMTEQLNWTEVVEHSVRFLSSFSFRFLWFCFWWAVFLFFFRRYSPLNVES